jgi:hypothetical protein
MSVSFQYKTKKELKASINQELLYQETSMFGKELKLDNPLPPMAPHRNSTNCNRSQNPSSWYANVTVEVVDGVPIIRKVS